MTADGEVEHLPYDCGLTRPVIELLGDMQAEFLDVSCSSNVLLGADPLLMSFWECTFGSVLFEVYFWKCTFGRALCGARWSERSLFGRYCMLTITRGSGKQVPYPQERTG